MHWSLFVNSCIYIGLMTWYFLGVDLNFKIQKKQCTKVARQIISARNAAIFFNLVC
jgi:hypothetical protein